MKTASWVIIDKSTGDAILETFSQRVVECLNTEKYTAVSILEYLQGVNRKIKENILKNN